MQIQLIAEDKESQSQTIPVDVPAFTIGRAKGAHLHINNTHVSRQHCVIYTHDGTATIQDWGGENGTYVNGNRISSPQELKDGDKIVIATYTFSVSIIAEQPEPVPNLMFEIRYGGQIVSVTKDKLFDLAKKGRVLPDDLITIAGTKVFADSIEGIVFGDKPPAVAPPPVAVRSAAPEPAPLAVPEFWKTENSNPYDSVASETLPSPYTPAQRQTVYNEIGKTLDNVADRINTPEGKKLLARGGQIFGSVLAVVCLLSILWFFFGGDRSPEGIIYVEGILTLDGVPLQGANVVLNPRNEAGHVAGGLTDSRGRFKVTTAGTPVGSGAREGEYDVTFSKVEMVNNDPSPSGATQTSGSRQSGTIYVIPQKYDNPDTSGLEPIRIEAGGKKSFIFELVSAQPPTANTPSQESSPSSPQ